MYLREIAYSRAGDKGDSNNISVIPKKTEYVPKIKEILTEEKIRQSFTGYNLTKVEINYYENLELFNILIFGVLNGGVSMNYNLDRHGKSFSDLVLDILIDQ